MATFLDCVNGVLRRIRETEAVSVTDTAYVKLVSDFVNEAKREVEDAWSWSVLRTTKTISTVSGTQNYEIPGTNPRSRLLVVYVPSLKRDLYQASQSQMHEWTNLQGTTNGDPQYFSIGNSTASTGVLTIDLWPVPTSVLSVKVDCVVPQADLVNSTDTLYVPSELVIQGAYLRAINERGEDGGRLSDQQADLYRKALASYIAIEAVRYDDETTWEAV
jgi:hypothetical protein